MNVVLAIAALLAAASPGEPAPGHPRALPVQLVEHRFVLVPRLEGGRVVRLYSDSGGGHTILAPELVAAARLRVEHPDAGPDAPALTGWPRWAAGAGLPSPSGRVLVMSLTQLGPGFDGFLGQDWFAGRTWTFDYPGKRLLLNARGELPAGKRIPFHLPRRGPDAAAFGRITIQVDGKPLDVLFDTGATTELSPEALAKIADGGAAARATSFMKAAVFDGWRKAHPDWTVLEKAEARTGADMIRVPAVVVAGQTVGPVWFTRRPDPAFDTFMSSMMDAPVVGALGGSGLRHFRITVDYAAGVAVFER
ncbi:MAG TPA: hypothetical protein VMH40_16775 [Myxococcaceae bacterium]|nr:hypothetical protein [Myxococcaceae bacterium]